MRFLEEEKEWRLPGLLYADDLVLCGESDENLRAMVGCFEFKYLGFVLDESGTDEAECNRKVERGGGWD